MIEKISILLRKFYKTPIIRVYWNADEYDAMSKAVQSGQIVNGSSVARLEAEIGKRFGFRAAIGTNLARSAIQTALEAVPADGRDEVIVPSYGCSGTAQPILQAGFKPVFCDVGTDFNVRAEDIRNAVTDRTRAAIVPGLFGKPVKWKPITQYCKEKDIYMIDDASQVLGTPEGGKNGDVGVFSFSLGKLISSTGGGVLCYTGKHHRPALEPESRTDVIARAADVMLRARLRKYTLPLFSAIHVLDKRLKPHSFGYKKRALSNLDAAIALKQLDKIDEILQLRRKNAKMLIKQLEGVPATLPQYASGSTFSKFAILIDEKAPRDRHARGRKTTAFVRAMARRGIECEWNYLPLHLRAPFDQFNRGRLNNTEAMWWRSVSLPIEPDMSEDEMSHVADSAKKSFSEAGAR